MTMLISEKPKMKRKKIRHNEYYNMVGTFDNLYKQSKEGKNFNKLMDIISSDNNIELAFRNIKGNAGSSTAGVDKKSIKDISKLSKDKYLQIVKAKLSNYHPKPVRRVEIPKPNGKTRPLGIPTIWDRIIQQCILQVLEPICEAKFHERNNGFRPNRSVENAMAQCYKMINQQHLLYVVDIDIKGFFDNVNHCKLRKQMWNMGIQDKKLLCIISEMLKAPIQMPDGRMEYPTKGTPQGGILSPLLSNIVLNELDWWITSQWELMPTKKQYKTRVTSSGVVERSSHYRALRTSNLKEMFIVRYADDFKIFCKDYHTAKRTFIATEKWLQERLKLEISKEKSKIVNLKNNYSEFLGFKLKAMQKGNKYVVKSRVSNKALKNAKTKLVNQIEKIQNPRDEENENFEVRMYNTMVVGLHNYYKYATLVSKDFNKIHNCIRFTLRSRLRKRIKKNGIINNKFIEERYGASKGMRYVRGAPLIPVSYVQHKNPMYKKREICQYTPEGRKAIHKHLGLDFGILMKLMKEKHTNNSIEYMDNRISLYCAQKGKCAITQQPLEFDEIHCHHKVPKYLGGTDSYQNLVIIHKDIHIIIHANNSKTIESYRKNHKLDKNMIKKINRLRAKLGKGTITQTEDSDLEQEV